MAKSVNGRYRPSSGWRSTTAAHAASTVPPSGRSTSSCCRPVASRYRAKKRTATRNTQRLSDQFRLTRIGPLVPFQVTSQTRPEGGGDRSVRGLARRLAHGQHATRHVVYKETPTTENEVWRSNLER